MHSEHSQWKEFLKVWPRERIEAMTLHEYTSYNDKDTFTYWIETKLRGLGSIKGGSSYKFGIFKHKEITGPKNHTKSDQTSDAEYSWRKPLGDNKDQAFARVKRGVVDVIRSIGRDNIQPINDVPLGPSFKWKIAFLYQDPDKPRLVSIYSPKKLKRYFQGQFSNRKLSYYDYHELILAEKDPKTDTDILVFSRKIWEKMDKMEAVDKQQRSFKESMPSVNVTDRIQTSKQPLNQILYGPPGTGKTYHTVNKALEIIDPGFYKENREDRESLNNRFRALIKNETVRFITFHQSFSYEDFVEGLKATTKDGKPIYNIEDGVFKRMCELANSNSRVVLIIDEINRGNISSIFGELITLIEESKRAGAEEALSVTLPYSKEPFRVPKNLYLIGTMNTADRSLALMDTALRRRFDFIEMMPKTEKLKKLNVKGIEISEMLSKMNKRIEVLYDREHSIGHAFFMPLQKEELDKEKQWEDLKDIFANKIIPLLEEYFFEDWEKIRQVLGDNKKHYEHQFIRPNEEGEEEARLMFENDDYYSADQYKSYERNKDALKYPESFIGIYEDIGASENDSQ